MKGTTEGGADGPERARLIDEAAAFVVAASRLPGVLRIALLGSLATTKLDPKDVDLLVTVSDAADRASLAKVARRLKGRAQSINRGADVFVSDPNNTYLERICHWKRCGPGIRASCDALSCGRRLYLHDETCTVCCTNTNEAAASRKLSCAPSTLCFRCRSRRHLRLA